VISTGTLSFGSTIRWLREARHVGLRSLARATALSPSYLSRIERDRVPPPSPEIVRRIAMALTADEDDLLGAAGFLPERVNAFIRQRPEAVKRVISLMDRMTDDEVEAFCEAWRRHVTRWTRSTSPSVRS